MNEILVILWVFYFVFFNGIFLLDIVVVCSKSIVIDVVIIKYKKGDVLVVYK